MSLLLNGAKTMTIAGTEMQCLEIYTGEAYTLPINFTDNQGNPANALSPNAWSLGATAKFYTVDNVTYSTTSDVVTLGNINLNNTQPNSNAYTLVTAFSNAANGTAYLYVGNNITGTANVGIPNVSLANNAANSTLVIVTLTVSKQSVSNASLTDINREPLGFIVRYQ
jgi:hypothetical protein